MLWCMTLRLYALRLLMAQKHWQKLLLDLPNLVTISYVFDELVTFLNSRGYHAKAITVGNTLLNSSFIEFVQIDETLFLEGWMYFQQHDDKTYSLTDCISFIVMQKLQINTALFNV